MTMNYDDISEVPILLNNTQLLFENNIQLQHSTFFPFVKVVEHVCFISLHWIRTLT